MIDLASLKIVKMTESLRTYLVSYIVDHSRYLRIIVPVLLLIMGGVLASYLHHNAPKAARQAVIPQTPPVVVERVNPMRLAIPVYSRGEVSPGVEIPLVMEVAGSVQYLSPNLVSGGFFKQGEVLLALDKERYDLELTKAKTQLTIARQRYEQIRLEVADEEDIEGLASPKKYRQRRVRQARARMNAAKADMKLVSMQMDKTQLIAPFDGRVRESVIGVGQIVSPGFAVARVYSVDAVEIRLPLTDRQLALLDLPMGYVDAVEDAEQPQDYPQDPQQEQLQADPVDEHSEPTPVPERDAMPMVDLKTRFGNQDYYWKGRIVRSEGGLDVRNRLLYLVARVDNPYRRDPSQPGRPPLSAGQFVEAAIHGKAFDNVVVLPRKILRNGNEVWVVQDGQLSKRAVDIVYKGKDRVYISAGLHAGDLVVRNPMAFAIEGMRVKAIRESGEGEPGEGEPASDIRIGDAAQPSSASVSELHDVDIPPGLGQRELDD